MANAQRPVVQIVRHTTESSIVVLGWQTTLELAGFAVREPVTIGEPGAGDCDVVVLCGVGPDLVHAEAAVLEVARRYPMQPIVIVTHHQDPQNIARFALSRSIVVSLVSGFADQETFVDAVRKAFARPPV